MCALCFNLLGGAPALSVLSACVRTNCGTQVALCFFFPPVFSTLPLKEEEEGALRGDSGEERSLIDPNGNEVPMTAAIHIIECVHIHAFSVPPFLSLGAISRFTAGGPGYLTSRDPYKETFHKSSRERLRFHFSVFESRESSPPLKHELSHSL